MKKNLLKLVFGTITFTCLFLSAYIGYAETEPNNTTAQANILDANGSQSGVLPTDADFDWYKIVLDKDGYLKITHSITTGNCMQMQLFEADGTTLLDMNGNCGFSSYRYFVDFKFLAASTYYLKVYKTGGSELNYALNSTFATSTYTSDAEPDNDFLTATLATIGTPQTGHLGYRLNAVRDITDFYKVVIPSEGKLRVDVTNDAELCVQLELFQKVFPETSIANNGWCGYSTFKSNVEYNNLAAGTYYIKALLRDEISSYYGGYQLDFIFTQNTYINDAETNDITSNAASMNLDNTNSGRLGYVYGDVSATYTTDILSGKRDNMDWYRIRVQKEGRLRFTLNSEATLCAQMAVYLPNDTVNAIKDNGWCGYSNYNPVMDVIVYPGEYLIKVWDSNWNYNTRYGGYTLKNEFAQGAVADFGFKRSDYTFVFENNSQNAVRYIWNFGDNSSDYYSFGVNPTHTYKLPGVYTVKLIADSGIKPDTLEKYVVIEGIQRIVSNKGGNTGDASVYIYGGGLTAGSKVQLVKEGAENIIPVEITYPFVEGLRMKLDLRGKPAGVWNVVVEAGSGGVYTFENGYTIEDGVAAKPFVQLAGRNKILFNRWQTYTIQYGNTGNVDATGVPLWLAVSNIEGLEIEFVDFEINWTAYAFEKGYNVSLAEVPISFETDNVNGEPFNAKVYPLFVPVIPAGVTEEVRIRIKSPSNCKIEVWVNDPYFQSPFNAQMAQCMVSVMAEGLVDATTGAIPVLGCVQSVGKLAYNPYEAYRPAQKKSWGSWLWDLSVTAVDCGVNLSGAGAVAKFVGLFAVNMYNYGSTMQDCKDKFKDGSANGIDINAVSSFDPNEIIGPTGYGAQNFTNNNDGYTYTIFFENKSTATAPAQEVVVIDTLDTNVFDFNTLTFGLAGFGDKTIAVLPGAKTIASDLDLGTMILRLTAGFDKVTGIINWHFVTLDKITLNLPEDPEKGFLPPNVTSPEGEGFVIFSIGLKAGLNHDTEISNKANIIFDLNQPIETNEYINTIDLLSPISQVETINSVTNSSTFNVSWSGSDSHSGINYYTVFVSQNNAEFKPWITISGTQATFSGQMNSSYRFYSIATDKLGNTEAPPATFDASTLVTSINSVATSNFFSIFPNPVKDNLRIEFNTAKQVDIKIVIADIQGRELLEKHSTDAKFVEIDVSHLEAGVYFVTCKTMNAFSTQRVVIMK